MARRRSPGAPPWPRPRLPAPYPLRDFDLANRVAIVARDEGWCADYVAGSYGRLEEGLPAGSDPNLASIRDAGQEPDRVIA